MQDEFSTWDFELDALKIELKFRDFLPEAFTTQFFAAHKADKMIKQKAALYIVGFKKGVYYLNLKAVNFAEMKKETLKLSSGKLMENYVIPFNLFTKIKDKQDLLNIIQENK
ncbi:hypothetical protein Q0M94_19270 (plasmid) [Deinococcus radiomollis]|uniref:hypothetical protein n=1 Tax=Deinococcus radiomollis TaxID=468916 RepID=UPI00389255BD